MKSVGCDRRSLLVIDCPQRVICSYPHYLGRLHLAAATGGRFKSRDGYLRDMFFVFRLTYLETRFPLLTLLFSFGEDAVSRDKNRSFVERIFKPFNRT